MSWDIFSEVKKNIKNTYCGYIWVKTNRVYFWVKDDIINL